MFSGGKRGILSLEIKGEDTLYEHYMAFVQGGGLFVPTTKSYELGDDIFFLLDIYLRPEPIPMTGKVVWVTHKGSASFKQQGVGVQLSDEHEDLKTDIEQALTGTVHSHKPTLTM
jgi:type IV pilus assembly protein PilZ